MMPVRKIGEEMSCENSNEILCTYSKELLFMPSTPYIYYTGLLAVCQSGVIFPKNPNRCGQPAFNMI